MNTFSQLMVALLLGWMIYQLSKRLKANPEMLSKAALNKSFGTMGILALILIAFIALLVFAVRNA